MPNQDNAHASDGGLSDSGDAPRAPMIGVLVICALMVLWFFGFETRYGPGSIQSAFAWIWSAWNPETDYEHGPLFPLVIAGLVFYRFADLKACAGKGSMWGLWVVFLGVLFYAIGYRTLQPRVTMGALPFILWGSSLYLWGWSVGRLLLFPFFFFLAAIPLPSFQQATVHLQLLATSMAHHGAALFGVETIVKGTAIHSLQGKWEPLEIAGGCSGIRSLMALIMISGAWAYIARMSLLKKAVLFAAAFPLAIIGNALRVISIFVIAEYGDPVWARKTWHDWSGLLLFYPISLFLLLVVHSALEGGLPWRKSNRRQVRRTVVHSDVATLNNPSLGTES